jgi:hypothetical protein
MYSDPTTPPLRARRGAQLAFASVLLLNGLFLLNNLGPYLGTNNVAAMTMFSRLDARAENHLFMPRLNLSEAGTYVRIVRLGAEGLRTPAGRQLREFVDWTAERGRTVNLSFLRFQVNRACRSAPGARLSLILEPEGGGRLDYRDACAQLSTLNYPLLSGFPECRPGCESYLRRWAGSVRLNE